MAVSENVAGTPVPIGWIVAIVVGVVLILLGQFGLDGLSDSSPTWHWVQHGVFVVCGILVGIGGLKLYGFGQRRA
jgi:hypothetical protein